MLAFRENRPLHNDGHGCLTAQFHLTGELLESPALRQIPSGPLTYDIHNPYKFFNAVFLEINNFSKDVICEGPLAKHLTTHLGRRHC